MKTQADERLNQLQVAYAIRYAVLIVAFLVLAGVYMAGLLDIHLGKTIIAGGIVARVLGPTLLVIAALLTYSYSRKKADLERGKRVSARRR